MENSRLVVLLLVATLVNPSFSFFFGKKDKTTDHHREMPTTDSHLCSVGEPLKDHDTHSILTCTPGLYNSCPASHSCTNNVCCLLPENQQVNPCKTGRPHTDPISKAFTHCHFEPPDHYSCPSGYECNTDIQDISSVCCPSHSTHDDSEHNHHKPLDLQTLAANVSALWKTVNELQRCCGCGPASRFRTQQKHDSHHHDHDTHHHEHDDSHEDHEHISEQHEGKQHFHKHKHGKHYFDAEIHAHCEVRPNTARVLPDMVSIVGSLHFSQKGSENLEISINLQGWHIGQDDHHHRIAIHVHEFGDLRDSCESVGEHYNPTNVSHGGPADISRHIGDMGNYEVSPEGKIVATKKDSSASLIGKFALIGRAIVVHEGPDDLGRGDDHGSSTHGNAGHRLACCVIGYASREH